MSESVAKITKKWCLVKNNRRKIHFSNTISLNFDTFPTFWRGIVWGNGGGERIVDEVDREAKKDGEKMKKSAKIFGGFGNFSYLCIRKMKLLTVES